MQLERNSTYPTLLGSVCTALDAANIEYVILRRVEHLRELGPRDDIDIVVKQEDLRDVQHVVSSELLLRGAICFAKKITPANCQFAIAGFCQEGDRCVLRLDFQAGLGHKETILLPEKILLADRVKFNGIWRPSPASEALALLLHCVVTKRKFRDSDVIDIESLFEKDPQKFEEIAKRVIGDSAAGQVVAVLQKKTTTNLLEWNRRLVVKLVWPQFYRYAHGQLRNLLEMSILLFKRRGALVVLVGPDGSGKTTLLSALDKKLASTGIKVTNVYFGLTTPLLPTKWIMRKLRHRKDPSESYKDVNMTKSITGKKRFTYFLGSCHAILDIYLRYYVFARFSLSRANIVLCDRYFYDILINPVPTQVYGMLKAFILYLTPKPDLTFVLMDDSKAIYARKPELSLVEIERQQAIFREILVPATNGEVLQQNPDVDNVAEIALEKIISVYARRNA